jgi:DNA polymerase-3 subunit epsilon/ATP-dependent DNA helicase DinG
MTTQADVEAARTRLDHFWRVVEEFVTEMLPRGERDEYGLRLRITSAVRAQPLWVDIEVAWDDLSVPWAVLLDHLLGLVQALQDVADVLPETGDLERITGELTGAYRQLSETVDVLEHWVMRPDENQVYWVETANGNQAVSARARRPVLRMAPVHVGGLVQENILFRNDTVVLTSATLRAAGSFDYVRDRLAAHDADVTYVGSPFDYAASTLLYLPTDLPDPNASTCQAVVEQALIALAKALEGRTLALFTSYAQLRRTTAAIGPALTQAGITVLSQAAGGPRHQLLEAFKSTERTVLLGTRSFWEGVDVVGEALSAVVIVRLPFAVPSDPIVAARSETFDDPFHQYQVPDAILRFRQGFGRLIRSKTDRGVVVVLDKRVTSKTYGRLFLESLPECTVQQAPLMNLPAAAKGWLDEK